MYVHTVDSLIRPGCLISSEHRWPAHSLQGEEVVVVLYAGGDRLQRLTEVWIWVLKYYLLVCNTIISCFIPCPFLLVVVMLLHVFF